MTRGPSNLKVPRRYAHPVDRTTGLLCDQRVVLPGFYSHKGFAAPRRRIRFQDPPTAKTRIFLTNHFAWPALTITALYRCRWPVELFCKWIQQHLRIKAFCGTSENPVQLPIGTAVSADVLVAIVKKRRHLPARLYEILPILSLTMFEKIPGNQRLAQTSPGEIYPAPANQLLLFN